MDLEADREQAIEALSGDSEAKIKKKNKGNTVQKAEYRLHRWALEELLEVEK